MYKFVVATIVSLTLVAGCGGGMQAGHRAGVNQVRTTSNFTIQSDLPVTDIRDAAIAGRVEELQKESKIDSTGRLELRFRDLPPELKAACRVVDENSQIIVVHSEGDIRWPFDKDNHGTHIAYVFSAIDGALLGFRMDRHRLV